MTAGQRTRHACAAMLDVGAILDERSGEALALNERYMNPQFGRILRTLDFARTWVGGEGAYLIDDTGERYLDFVSGYGMFALGRNHPGVRAQLETALAAQTANLPQMGVTILPAVLAEQLIARAPASLGAALLCNSGTEAIEGALKLARMATRRSRIVYCSGAFHGLTLGSLSLNGGSEFRERAGSLLPDCDPVPFGDIDALRQALAQGDVAAFIVEPVQGKGVRLPPAGYLSAAQAACAEHGTLFIVDEVQTGLGRTGRFLALEHWGLEPDLVTVAKALSGGYVPIGAVLARRSVYDAVFDSMEHAVVHGSTFGNNDLAAAAGIATLAELDREALVERGREMGARLLELTRPLVERHEVVHDVRGLGMIWAIELGAPSRGAGRALWQLLDRRQPGIFAQCVTVPLFREHRILTQVAGHHMNVIKALPPLVTDEADLVRFAEALDEVLGGMAHLGRALTSVGLGMARRAVARAPSDGNGRGSRLAEARVPLASLERPAGRSPLGT